jgi:8-oxo-dGTP pyrophosphatase MutT (NUDIX family)
MTIRVRAIIIEDKKVLLMHRVKNGQEYWAFPGGAVEESDTNQVDALKRECLEELGVEVLVGDLFIEKSSLAHDAIGQMEYFYNCKILRGEVGTGTGPEFSNRDIDKYGTYEVEWLQLNFIKDKNVYPLELRDKIIENYQS